MDVSECLGLMSSPFAAFGSLLSPAGKRPDCIESMPK